MTLLNRCRLYLLAAHLILLWISVSANPEKSPARVLIIQDRSVEDGFKVEVESNGEKRELQLLPAESIWSNEAKALIIERNEHGKQIYERVNIPKDLKVYHDQKSGSFLSLKDGKLNGILDSNYTIKSEGENHFTMRFNFNEEFGEKDFITIDELSSKSTRGTLRKLSPRFYNRAASYTPEVAVIVDSILADQIGSNCDIFEYLTIFWNGVNSRFQTIDSPKINIKLVGCVVMRNSQDEPFISDNLDGEGRLNCNNAYDDTKYWIAERYETLPEHDLMFLQVDRKCAENIAGLAIQGGVCGKNQDASSALAFGIDIGAVFGGVKTAAHEVAHSLGSPHDPQVANECDWNNGYLMSYVGGSINKLFFSQCSKDSMTAHLSKSESSCTTENLSDTEPSGVYISNKLPGEVISMTDECKVLMENENAEVYTDVESESELCYDIKCVTKYPEYWVIGSYGRPAAEGSECPSGKHCHNGECV